MERAEALLGEECKKLARGQRDEGDRARDRAKWRIGTREEREGSKHKEKKETGACRSNSLRESREKRKRQRATSGGKRATEVLGVLEFRGFDEQRDDEEATTRRDEERGRQKEPEGGRRRQKEARVIGG